MKKRFTIILLGFLTFIISLSVFVGWRSWNSNQIFYANFDCFKEYGKETRGYISSLNQSKGSRFIDVKCVVPGTTIGGYLDIIEFDDIPIDKEYWKSLEMHDNVLVQHHKKDYSYGVVLIPEDFRKSKITTLTNPILGGKILLYSGAMFLVIFPIWLIFIRKSKRYKLKKASKQRLDQAYKCKVCLHVLYEGEYIRKVYRTSGKPEFRMECAASSQHYSDFQVVPLQQVMELDGSLNYIEEMEIGEMAVREGLSSKWKCSPITDEHLL